MTTLRTDSELGAVFPVVLTVGDEPPQEIGVIRAGHGPEAMIAELAGLLHDCADVMVVGGDEAIRLARIRYDQLQRGLGPDPVVEATVTDLGRYSLRQCACGCGGTTVDPALIAYDQEVLGRLAVEVTGHAIAAARPPLTTAEALALQPDEPVVVASAGTLRGHCAHDVPLSATCAMCGR